MYLIAYLTLQFFLAGVPVAQIPDATGAPNSDPHYRQLRSPEPYRSVAVESLVLQRDVARLTFDGTLTFLTPVLDRVVYAIFSGRGSLQLTPATSRDAAYLRFILQENVGAVSESFDTALLAFTDETFQEASEWGTEVPTLAAASKTFEDFAKKLRQSPERPRSMLERLLSGEDSDNLAAALLADLYHPSSDPMFNAYIKGGRYKDLRFLIRPRGAVPQILSPEEVGLLNVDPGSDREGIWYLSHYKTEHEAGTASSLEDKRIIDALHYTIEADVDGEKISSRTRFRFQALAGGARILRFSLLPSLRVSEVQWQEGGPLDFIQEPEREDGSLYVILPEPMEQGREYEIALTYRGDDVIENAGGGNFYVGARTSWYPSVNAFNDRATFDLTFTNDKKWDMVSVGRQVESSKEKDKTRTRWTSDVPLAVAGFNYGRFKKEEEKDKDLDYLIQGYATQSLPGYLKGAEEIGGMNPSRLLDKAMVEATNSLRIFSHWFGPLPYGRLAMTQQPDFNFGQSWPSLVYLPLVAFFDSTQRWRLMGGIESGLTDFVQEVGPHEVAHQWWGHLVGWATYHDQWISEGFADFSAGLYVETTEKPDRLRRFWEQSRKAIVEKNRYGWRPNDVGPIWMGTRLITKNTAGAYGNLVYPKGAFVLHMLRRMMFDSQTGDEKFMQMMQEFVREHYNQNASTESFKAIVEKHMTPIMNLDGNGRLDWFFDQWVYSSDLPSYKLTYSLEPDEGSKLLFNGRLEQSGVSPNFKMVVPIYIQYNDRWYRLAQIPIQGSGTTEPFQIRLPSRPQDLQVNYFYDVLTDGSTTEKR